MKTRIKLPHDQCALWYPMARHGDAAGPRMMPSWFKGWADPAIVRGILSHPGKYVFISEPFGADRGATHYLFNEWDTAIRSDDGKLVDWFPDFLDKLAGNGKVPVVYMGTPRTQHDEMVVAAEIFDWFDENAPGTQFALDAASGMGAGSATGSVVEKYGGPERFWIEAHPSIDKAHWKGYRVVSLARERKQVDNQWRLGPLRAWYPTPDNYHPEIAVMMTGHGRTNPQALDTEEIRKAKTWAGQGKIIGWQLHEPAWGDVFEVV